MKRKPPRGPGDGPYEVGYGKPPKHTQFKPGQSGNSKAGPAGSVILKLRSGMLCKKKSPSGRATGHARSQGWMRSYASPSTTLLGAMPKPSVLSFS